MFVTERNSCFERDFNALKSYRNQAMQMALNAAARKRMASARPPPGSQRPSASSSTPMGPDFRS
eukprot:5147368-Pleurochrysis_carterae.AAC.9